MGGVGFRPISEEEVYGYCDRHGIEDFEQREELQYLVREMDDEFLEWLSMKRAAPTSGKK